MRLVQGGIDLTLALFGALSWSFAAFVFGSRYVSPAAGGLLGIGLLLSSGAMLLGAMLRDRRQRLLNEGTCPRCRSGVTFEHRHRRWEPGRSVWEAPSTAWECRACGFAASEEWACPACPE